MNINMSNIAISELTNEASVLGDNDLLLISKAGDNIYTSSKLKIQTLDDYIIKKFSICANSQYTEIWNQTDSDAFDNSNLGKIVTVPYDGLLQFFIDTEVSIQTINNTKVVVDNRYRSVRLLKVDNDETGSTEISYTEIAYFDIDNGGISNSVMIPIRKNTKIRVHILTSETTQRQDYTSLKIGLFHN